MLLELLSLITPMVEFPQIFRDKTIHFQTDNLALSQLYRSMWPIREPTAYFLRALNFVTQAMNINLEITWRKRKTDIFSKVADDLTHSNFTAVSGLVRNRRVSTRAVSSFLGALCQESFWGPWNRISFLAALKKELFGKAYKQKLEKLWKWGTICAKCRKFSNFQRKW